MAKSKAATVPSSIFTSASVILLANSELLVDPILGIAYVSTDLVASDNLFFGAPVSAGTRFADPKAIYIG